MKKYKIYLTKTEIEILDSLMNEAIYFYNNDDFADYFDEEIELIERIKEVLR